MKPLPDELHQLSTSGGGNLTYQQIAEQYPDYFRNGEAVRNYIRIHRDQLHPTPPRVTLQASPFPRYDKPLEMSGDALVIFDPEFPFHHAEFINRLLELAQAWKIEQLTIGGDVLHFDTFSQWGASWQSGKIEQDSLTEETERRLREKIQKLPPEHQGELLEELIRITEEQCGDDEILLAQKELRKLEQLFTRIDYVLGNHDDRFLRKLNSPLTPQKLLDFIGLREKCWNIGPYFFSTLTSGGETFRIEHPRSAAQITALKLADKYECSTIVGHDHYQDFKWSTSGRHYAIHAGCTCDELRMPYAAQRSTNRPAHCLGAVIVREGRPYLLHPRVDWERYKRM